jgi:hypothetical protein
VVPRASSPVATSPATAGRTCTGTVTPIALIKLDGIADDPLADPNRRWRINGPYRVHSGRGTVKSVFVPVRAARVDYQQ